MVSILDKIIEFKKKEVKALKKKKSLQNLKKEIGKLPKKKPGFLKRLKVKKGIAVIAEIKRKSPSKGLLCRDFKPIRIAKEYEAAGAKALSVLTDRKFFGGSVEVLHKVKRAVRLPILRKEFIVDEYQLFESRFMGADAVLLIAGALSFEELQRFSLTAERLGLDVLFEVHTMEDIKKILPLRPKLVGINNRDLNSFCVNTRATTRLIKFLPKKTFVVSESGIKNHQDLVYLQSFGVGAVLVGESLMKQKKPGAALKKLLGNRGG